MLLLRIKLGCVRIPSNVKQINNLDLTILGNSSKPDILMEVCNTVAPVRGNIMNNDINNECHEVHEFNI